MNTTESQLDPVAEIFREVYAEPKKDGNTVARFLGMQSGGIFRHESFPLYILTAQVGPHPVDSTVSDMTLARYGYTPPAITDRYDSRTHDDNLEPLCN